MYSGLVRLDIFISRRRLAPIARIADIQRTISVFPLSSSSSSSSLLLLLPLLLAIVSEVFVFRVPPGDSPSRAWGARLGTHVSPSVEYIGTRLRSRWTICPLYKPIWVKYLLPNEHRHNAVFFERYIAQYKWALLNEIAAAGHKAVSNDTLRRQVAGAYKEMAKYSRPRKKIKTGGAKVRARIPSTPTAVNRSIREKTASRHPHGSLT